MQKIGLVFFVTFLFASMVAAEQHIVDRTGADGAFTTINAAIQAAADGDSILVKPGKYEESLVIDRQVSIEGSGVNSTTLDSLFGDAIILTNDKPLAIKNMLIRAGGNGITASASEGMRLRNSTEEDRRFLNVKNCVISNCGRSGVYFETGGSVLISNTIIQNCGQSAVTIDAMDRERVYVGGYFFPRRFSTDLSISNSVLVNNGNSGVTIRRSNDGGASITNSIISGNSGYAIENRIVRVKRYYDLWPPEDKSAFESVRLNYSCIFDNAKGVLPEGTTEEPNSIIGQGLITENPLLDDDLKLSAGSPGINSGDPSSTFRDPDGSRNDIGAFGGPGAAEWIGYELGTPGGGGGGGGSSITLMSSNDFNLSTSAENKLLAVPPGAAGQFDMADVFFKPFSADSVDFSYTDGFGASITLDAGEGVILFGNPMEVGDDYVYMRISAWTNNANVAIALGALDAQPAANLSGAALNGSVEANILLNCSRFVNRFGHIEAFYKSERGAIVPVVQITSNTSQRVIVQMDNLEIYRLSLSEDGGSVEGASSGKIVLGDQVFLFE